jgi:tetratricopeptide (TPR) repeat protein
MMTKASYSTREVATLVGLTPARLAALARNGVVRAHRGARGELRFDFGEVALLRSVRGVTGCSPGRLAAALRHLERWSAWRRPLQAFRIEADGRSVVARDEQGAFEPASGQVLLPFDGVDEAGAEVVRVKRPSQGEACFLQGVRLEPSAPVEAVAAYERALALDPDHVGASVNLGRLRHLSGDPAQAVILYERALGVSPDDPTALFNLGIAFEDLERFGEALACYERAVASDPGLADAHFNAARLCERRGDQLGAMRHMRRYRAICR